MSKEETLIENYMKKLGISHDEAVTLIADDKKIDRMTSTKAIDSDLTAEQRKVVKSMKNTDTKRKTPTVYKFDQKAKKKDVDKAYIIAEIGKCLAALGIEYNVLNEQRELSFGLNGENYTITLIKKRK